jgi:predicted  nucleic acid-binding Zn-ribbon protein
MAKLYFGGTLIGGDVEQADLDALDAKIDDNKAEFDQHVTDITAEQAAQDGLISDNETAIATNANNIASLKKEIEIIGNATVAARYLLGSGTTAGAQEIVFVPDNDDWSGTTSIIMAKTDKEGTTFDFDNVQAGNLIQAGSSNGMGLFEVVSVDTTDSLVAEFTVTVEAGSSGHVPGEDVSITIGNKVDADALQAQITANSTQINQNTNDISQNKADIAQNSSDITDLDAELQRVEGITSSNDQAIQDLDTEVKTKFDTGTTTHAGNRLYASAGEMEDAVVKNAEDILQLSTGGNPAVDDLVDEMPKKVENYNYSNPGEGDGVKTIRVTSTYSTLTADPNTLYVVI